MNEHSPLREGHSQTWAKAILLGEHFVVYGYPTVAIPLQDLRMQATARPTSGPSTLTSLDYSGPLTQADPRFVSVARAFEVTREFSGCLGQALKIITVSDFPHRRGFGSSTAVADTIIHAVLDACRREATADELFALMQMAGQIAHGKPSGLDATATYSPCPIRFQGGQMRPLSQRIENASLIIVDSEVRGSTREAVGGLRRRYENGPDNVGPRINRLEALTQNAIMALDQTDAPAPRVAMNKTHAVLTELSLSLPILGNLTRAARSAKTLGIKLTGGGLGGYVIALATGESAARRMRAALEQAGTSETWSYRMRISKVDEWPPYPLEPLPAPPRPPS